MIEELLSFVERRGAKDICKLPGCWIERVDEHWVLAANGHGVPERAEPDRMRYDRTYRGRGNPMLYGRRCRILTTWRRRAPHNVRIEFEDGGTTICPIRCLRKEA